MVPMIETTICERWKLLLPEHRHHRDSWPWWEKARLASMYANLMRGDLVFDIGTEEGDLTALYAMWTGVGPAMFEPNPRVWPNVRVIFEANQLPLPTACWVGFVGAEARDASGENAYSEKHYAPEGEWPPCAYGPVIGDHGFYKHYERPDMPTTTIDSFAWTPDAITMDIEGAEGLVIDGAHGVLDRIKPRLWVSHHRTFAPDEYGRPWEQTHDKILSYGYHYEILGEDHELHVFYWHPDTWRPVHLFRA